MTIGATLQRARAARQLSVQQLSRVTRIHVRILDAMERDDWGKVPPGIFARGYLRAYAAEVGLDGHALAARFEAEQAPPPAEEESGERAAGLARPVIRLRWPALSDDARRWLAGPVFVALLVLVYFAGRLSGPDARPPADIVDTGAVATPAARPDAEQARPAASRQAPASAAAPAPTPPAPTPTAPAPAGPAPSVASLSPAPQGGVALPAADAPLELEVEATRACWVAASADAMRIVYRMLQPGERVQARGRVFTLRAGDAGALRLSVDGERASPLGGSGQVVSVRITRQNYRTLLTPHAGD